MSRPTPDRIVAAWREDLRVLEQLVAGADARWQAWIALDESHDMTATWRAVRETLARGRDTIRRGLDFYDDAMKRGFAR